MRGYLKIILSRPDGRRSESKLKDPNPAMIEAAEEAIYTMMTGVRFEPAKPKKKAKKAR